MSVAPGSRCVWIDASAGASGDMLLGALLDAGAPVEAVTAAIEALGVEPIEIRPRPTRRHGLRAIKADVQVHEAAAPRTVGDVLALVAAAALAPTVVAFARDVFRLVGTAEAAVHGEDLEQVHLHEVGALDSIADVVGCAAALHSLGLLEPRARVVVSSVALGSGSVQSSHGTLPVPVPAVLAILAGRGAAVVAGGDGELCTPTGAALLATLAGEWGSVPPMRIDTVGVGAGSADPPGRANVMRVVIGTALPSVQVSWRHDDLLEVEATVDDLDPRLWPAVLDALVEAGAVDAWLTPVVMRKGRPGNVVTALVAEDAIDAATRALFTHSTTLGVRLRPVARRALPRDEVVVRIEGFEVRVKRGLLDGEPVTVQTEYADAAAAAERLGIPVRTILDRAAALARGASQSEQGTPEPEKGAP
jgi:pyridinium-3,5-bisthiocarboxylic acid mononucleotide nickel chelatase